MGQEGWSSGSNTEPRQAAGDERGAAGNEVTSFSELKHVLIKFNEIEMCTIKREAAAAHWMESVR